MTTNIQSFAGDVQIDNGNLSVKTLEVKDGITKLGSNNTTYSNVGVMMTRKDGASNVAFLFTEDGANVVLGYTNDEALDDDRIDVLQDEKANLVVYGNVYVSGSVHGDGSTLTGLVTTLQSVTNFGAETNKTILFTNQNTGINVSSNVLVSGNVSANVYYGDGGLLSNITQTLEGITAIGNNTPYTLEFENDETAFVTLANVGIINTNPTSDLCIGSNVVFDDDGYDTLQVKGNVNAYEFHMQSITILPGYGLENVTEISNTTPNTISITNSTLSLITDSKVGIGIAPTTLDVGASGLHVDGHVRLGGAAGSNENQQLYVKSGGALGVMANTDDTDNQNTSLLLQSGATNNSNITLDGNSTDKYISFGTNTLERMRITDDGLGVSTTTPSSNLHVEGNTYISGNTQVGAGYLFVDTDTGNVGIGKTNPQYDIDVLGNINFTGAFYQGGSPFISTPWTITGDDIYYLKPGYVGIGTNSTGSNLQVSGNVYVDSYDAHSTTYGGVVINGGLAVSSNIHTSNIYAGNVYISDVYVSTSPDLDSVCAEGASTSRAMSITNETESTTNDSGALTVDGGIGVSGNIHCSNLYTSNALIVSNVYAGNVYASNLVLDDVWLDVSPDLQAVTTSGNSTTQSFFTTSTEPSTSPTTGAIQVRGGAGMQGNVYVGSNVYIQGGGLELTQVSNTFQITSSSNVVTEYVRSKKFIKYPRVAMTAATSGGYTASASSENNGTTKGQAWRAFDGLAEGERGYHSAASMYSSGAYIGSASVTGVNNAVYDGEWIKLQLPTGEKIKVMGAYFYPRTIDNTGYVVRTPYKGYILGSNTGSNGSWNLIAHFDGISSTVSSPGIYMFQNNTNEYYNHIALVANELYPDPARADVLNFAELEYFGIPEYDPAAHGTDVIARSVPNAPNTDWLEVYYDAKGLSNGSISTVDDLTPGGTKDGTATNVTISDSTFAFNGTSDIRSTVSTFTGDQPHTMSVWVNISTSHTLGDGYICVLAPSTGETVDQVSTIRYQTDGFNLQSWGNDIQMYNLGIEKGRWYHLVMVYDGGGVTTSSKRLYIDTVQNTRISGTTVTSNVINFSNTTLSLGSRVDGAGAHLTGSIANFRLFNRALTADEIWQLYAYQKDYFKVSPDVVTFKGGRFGIGTEEPKAVLDVSGTAIIDRTYTLVDNIVARQIVLSNSQYVHIPNLDLDRDGGTYKIVINLKNATNNNPSLSMYINDVSTSASYYNKMTQHATTTGALTNSTSEYLFGLGGGSQHYHEFILTRHAESGYPICTGTGMFHTGTSTITYSVQGWDLHAWVHFSDTNVRKISFQTYPYDAIEAGSIFTIYKYV